METTNPRRYVENPRKVLPGDACFMKTIETSANVSAEHTLTARVPGDVIPGEHRVVIVIEDGVSHHPRGLLDLPSHDLGPWPENLALRREELYGEWGR